MAKWLLLVSKCMHVYIKIKLCGCTRARVNSMCFCLVGTEVEMKATEARFEMGEWTPFSANNGKFSCTRTCILSMLFVNM